MGREFGRVPGNICMFGFHIYTRRHWLHTIGRYAPQRYSCRADRKLRALVPRLRYRCLACAADVHTREIG